jgi:hypothetical protein
VLVLGVPVDFVARGWVLYANTGHEESVRASAVRCRASICCCLMQLRGVRRARSLTTHDILFARERMGHDGFQSKVQRFCVATA